MTHHHPPSGGRLTKMTVLGCRREVIGVLPWTKLRLSKETSQVSYKSTCASGMERRQKCRWRESKSTVQYPCWRSMKNISSLSQKAKLIFRAEPVLKAEQLLMNPPESVDPTKTIQSFPVLQAATGIISTCFMVAIGFRESIERVFRGNGTANFTDHAF